MSAYVRIVHQVQKEECGHLIIGPDRATWTRAHPLADQSAEDFIEALGHPYARIYGGIPVNDERSRIVADHR